MLYALKDADRQARLEKETYGTFSAFLQHYFQMSNKKLSDLHNQKTLSVDIGPRRIQLKPWDICEITAMDIKHEAAQKIMAAYQITAHMAHAYAKSLRPCIYIVEGEDGSEIKLYYLMKIVNDIDEIQTIALDPDQVIKQD